MVEQNEWIPYQKLDWDDKDNNVFSIDTRDFHAGYRFVKKHPDYDIIKKYPHFFHTKEEIQILVNRYFEESGGKGEWRMFSLNNVDNWKMKYIRIWRTELGFVVCNSDNRALPKSSLNLSVRQEYLNHH